MSEVNRLRGQASAYKLIAPSAFWSATTQKLVEAYNGAGPDRWPQLARNVVSAIMREYPSAVLIHDWDYENCDGTYASFVLANSNFYENMRRIRSAKYSWWNILAYGKCAWEWAKAQAAYRAVCEYGWQGYAESAIRHGLKSEYPPEADVSQIGGC